MESKPGSSDILTVSEAATYLRISPWALRHWVSRGKVTHLKYLDGAVRFRKRDLDNFIVRNLRRKEASSAHEGTKKD
jgi:excisionase family DNA binding protein